MRSPASHARRPEPPARTGHVHRPPRRRRLALSDERFTVRLAATAQAPSEARQSVAHALGRRLEADALREAQLLVTELVTNAVRHGGLSPEDSITLEVLLRGVVLRVEVADGGPGFDPAAALEPVREDPGGWGLLLVSRLSSRWGVTRGRPNVAWFEIDLPA